MSPIRPDGKVVGALGFEYRMFGEVPLDCPREMVNAWVQANVAWSGAMMPNLRSGFVLVHDSVNPAELQALLAKLKA